MFPILFSLGSFQLKTLSIFLVMAFLACGFVFWRKGRDEHYLEEELFDAFLLSSVWGLVWARVGFIAFNFAVFGLSPLKWLDVFGYPGWHFFVGLMAAGWFMYRYAQKHRWDAFEILDFWILGVTASLIFLWIGSFLNGTDFGSATALPWGMVFPGVIQKFHPTQLYWTVFYILLLWYLSWVEFRYRLFNWYRGGKNTAQTGFLVSVFVIVVSLASLVMSFISAGTVIFDIRIDQMASVLGLLSGAFMLFNRSGRALAIEWPFRKKTDSIKQFKV